MLLCFPIILRYSLKTNSQIEKMCILAFYDYNFTFVFFSHSIAFSLSKLINILT
jgi:alkyl hydroperoxide reductase subunit AhpC